MKLKKLVAQKIAEHNQNKEEKEIFAVLDQYLDYIFRIDKQEMLANMKKLNPKHKYSHQKYHNLTAYDLQFHTQDNEWLTMYTRHIVNFYSAIREKIGAEPIENSGRKEFPVAVVEKYVATSPKFAQKRDEYAQAVVQACIIVHRNEEQDFICDRGAMQEERTDKFYDNKFRNRIIEAMTSISISENNIETALELNHDLWLRQTRWQTFNNNKELDLKGAEREFMYHRQPYDMQVLDQLDNQLFEKWNQLKDCKYYEAHREVIDRLGTAKPNMKLNAKEKTKLMNEVMELGHTYNQHVAKCLADYHALKDLVAGR